MFGLAPWENAQVAVASTHTATREKRGGFMRGAATMERTSHAGQSSLPRRPRAAGDERSRDRGDERDRPAVAAAGSLTNAHDSMNAKRAAGRVTSGVFVPVGRRQERGRMHRGINP